MPNAEAHHIVSVDYDELVTLLVREYGDFSLNQALRILNNFGVDVSGDLDVYWPADHYVIEQKVSERAARILERMHADPRLIFFCAGFPDGVPNATLKGAERHHSWTAAYAGLTKTGRSKQYVNDHPFLGRVRPTPEFYRTTSEPFIPMNQPEERVKYVYVDVENPHVADETYSARSAAESARFFARKS